MEETGRSATIGDILGGSVGMLVIRIADGVGQLDGSADVPPFDTNSSSLRARDFRQNRQMIRDITVRSMEPSSRHAVQHAVTII